jgi:hypothetical protein
MRATAAEFGTALKFEFEFVSGEQRQWLHFSKPAAGAGRKSE